LAKVSGLPTSVTVAGNNISNDVLSFNIDTPYGTQDITGVDKSAMERLTLRSDITGTLVCAFNTSATRSHATLKTPGSKTFVIGYPGATATFTAVTTDYQVAMGADGSLQVSAPFQVSDGTVLAWT
jgi:hypothetical protein